LHCHIERVEVLKGPYPVLYGNSIGAGLLSIITKQPQHEFSGSASGLVGSYDQKSASFDLTGPLNKEANLYYRLNGEIERSGTFIDYTNLKRNNQSFSLMWEASNAVTAHFVGMWHERETKRGTGLPVVGTVVSNGVAQIPINRYLGDPNHNFKASGPLVQAWADVKLNDAWTLTPRFQYTGFTGIYNELLLRGVQADGVTVNRVGRYDEERHHYPTGQLDRSGLVKRD
jgi:iron complex outermembrane recepter protein